MSRGGHGLGAGRQGARAETTRRARRPMGAPSTENQPASAETTSACGRVTQLTAWTGGHPIGRGAQPWWMEPRGLFPKHHRHLQPTDLWPQHGGAKEGQSQQSTPAPGGTSVGPTPTAGGKRQAGNLRGRRCRGQNRGRQSPAQSREVAGCTNQRKSCLSGKSVTSPENEDKAQQTQADSTGNRQRDSTIGSGTRRAVFTPRTGWPRRPGGTEAGCRAPRPA